MLGWFRDLVKPLNLPKSLQAIQFLDDIFSKAMSHFPRPPCYAEIGARCTAAQF
jgi:hypothetical protein